MHISELILYGMLTVTSEECYSPNIFVADCGLLLVVVLGKIDNSRSVTTVGEDF